MYLKKVEILGFKSFANKTTLEFLPTEDIGQTEGARGITSIVGPNGSGKSNVSDAIKWAMGEQSMKTLRGKKSEDVIFAGSGKKARLSSAHVTLQFDNSDKRIPLEYSDVVIQRKIFRSGESEYLINGSRVRLLDIVELLAKAGVGKDSYCVINQGMSDAVLNATPVERRSILEDAAGVKQHQIKKERSLKKLESTRENLERVNSLVREIEPHLRMLKRQAEKAQQGKDVAGQLREKQLELFGYLWHTFQDERGRVSKEKEVLGELVAKGQNEVESLSQQLEKESANIEDSGMQEKLEKERAELRGKLNTIERELIVCEGRVVIEKERLANQKTIEIIPVDLAYVREKLAKIRTNQEELISRVENAESMEELREIKEFARVIQQELFDLYDQAGKGEVAVKKDNSREIGEIQEKIDAYEAKREQLIKTQDELRKQMLEADRKVADEIKRIRQLREHFFQLERQLRAKQDELGKVKDGYNEAKISLARVEVREEDLVVEVRSELHCEVTDLGRSNKEIDRSQLEREISRLKIQFEQIGGIDPMVVDEYNETQARYEFLSNESKDLEQAITSLKAIVKEMDQRINEEFSKAFEQINHEFTKYFRIIFGGGNAHLVKIKNQRSKTKQQDAETVEDNDVEEKNAEEEQEMGVEIYACPPGKKIANLAMLSGGERSLTSLALLFAIISHNPPPFAILDEVEAALDEANSRRFSKILQELSKHTQFIAITHNRETMRQASLLYGVTMGEDGISKLLSVRLDQISSQGDIRQ